VQHVPRRQAETRLEEAEDPDRAQEEAGDEPDRPRDWTAAQDGRRFHPGRLVNGKQEDDRPQEARRCSEITHASSVSGTHWAFVSPAYGIR
jgi:hypothetical protein